MNFNCFVNTIEAHFEVFMTQLDLFEKPLSELDLLRKQFDRVVESMHAVRRGVFKRNSNLEKLYCDLHERLEAVERENDDLEEENRCLKDQLGRIDKMVYTLSQFVANMETVA